MNQTDLVQWLQERTALSLLDDEILQAIAPQLEERTIPINTVVVTKGTSPDRLYILRSGDLENSDAPKADQYLPGMAINLQSLLLNNPVQQTLITRTDCQFWVMKAGDLQKLVEAYPEINQAFSQQLAEEVEELSAQLVYEQERLAILQPYLIPRARRGIVGKSRYAVRLRSQIKEASKNRKSVLIFGEPGIEKDNLAALIHFGSDDRREPVIQVNCSKLQTSGADLFGRTGGKSGLIEALGKGTLIFNNIQELPPELIPAISNLLELGTYIPVSKGAAETVNAKVSQARIIIISEKMVAKIETLVETVIKVPPLRVRKSDIGDWVNYNISLICRNKGINRVQMTPEALRRLQAYDFPNNLRELRNLVERAIVQLQGCTEITEEIIWPSQTKKQQFRVNLLNTYPKFRKFLRSPWWPDRINYGFTVAVFAAVVAILFLGPQTRSQNFALNLFWAWWWPLILLIFPFLGRVWCAVCPFMIYGEITQKLSLWLFPRQLKKWPRQSAEKWGGWFLFGLFTLILLWEELWDLPNTAYLSACLLLLITAGAIIFSAIFERRFWCRYLCPIGGMNGMFAKLAITELRAQQGTCSAECNTYQCYKGGPQKGEGMETAGCPLYSHPAQLEENRDCVLCMTCLKACPHRSVEVNLRPPGIELWTTHIPRTYEVALLFLLLNAVFLHHLPQLQQYFNFSLNLDNFWIHLSLSTVVLALPAIIPGFADLIYRLISPRKPRKFIELAYGLLPFVLAINLAHYLRLGLAEGGRILPVTLATFGLDGSSLPVWVAHPAVIEFLQGTTLLSGILIAILLTQKIARQPIKTLLPQHLATIILGFISWKIVVGF
ncbi:MULTISPECIES: sigma 54-interacting transcriptional regulator [Limnospira]|uniref:Nitrogen assimilation regulatory protein n=1 Tax=Limnospira indica PCC 8005 TaxID=376219 RepID=A0A9P1KIP2_9CYAN|nr:sigma 54-interacting transcriptional regulator [Limnospira indica]CDM97844.1 Nitrogen assimilation regulatory protein [Limnospira indica PCC 8005]